MKEKEAQHSWILVTSLWSVIPIWWLSQTDIPSLTTVSLDKELAFFRGFAHPWSSSSSSCWFLEITPALSYYLKFLPSYTHNSQQLVISQSNSINNQFAVFTPHNNKPPFLLQFHSLDWFKAVFTTMLSRVSTFTQHFSHLLAIPEIRVYTQCTHIHPQIRFRCGGKSDSFL